MGEPAFDKGRPGIRNVTLVFIHPPKTGGSTIGCLFQPLRRIYDVLEHPHATPPQPDIHSLIAYRGGHKTMPTLARRCDASQRCCTWMMSFREPMSRLKSAFTTSVEDHQHFDCPRGSRLHRRLRRSGEPLTLERFTRYPAAERRACGLNVYLDMLAPPTRRRETVALRLARAEARVARLSLVALTEEFSRSIELLERVLDVRLRFFPAVFTYNPRVAERRSGMLGTMSRPTTAAVHNLSAAAVRVLRRDLRPDIALYEAARRRFDALLAAHMPAAALGDARDTGRVSPPSPLPFRCAWKRARCWDKLTTQHLKAYRGEDARTENSSIVHGDDAWPLLRWPARVKTWPIADVQSTSLWRSGTTEGRRQRLQCAAPCARSSEGQPGALPVPPRTHDTVVDRAICHASSKL